MIGGKQTSGPSPGERDQKRTWRKSEYILPRWSWSDVFFFLTFFLLVVGVVPTGVRTHVVATTVCATGSVNTLRVALTFFWYSFFAWRRNIHAWLKCLSHAHVVSLWSRLLPPHVSPVSVCCSLTVTSRPLPTATSPTHSSTPSCRTFPTWKRRSSALRTRMGSLTTWPSSLLPQVTSPRRSTRWLPWTMTWHLTNDPDHDVFDFSKTRNRERWTIRCSHSVCILCLARFSSVILFLREKAKKACDRETVARQREREEKEGSVISVAEWMSMQSPRNSVRSHSLQTHKEFYSDDRDLRGHLERRTQQAVLDENSVQRKLCLTEYDMEIHNLERGNSEYALFESQRELELLENIQWTDQAQRRRIHLCSELKMKDHLHEECHARSCQEFEELKKELLSRGKYCKTVEIGIISYAAWSGITYSGSTERSSTKITRTIEVYWRLENLPWSQLTEQLWQFQRSSSSSYHLEFKKA